METRTHRSQSHHNVIKRHAQNITELINKNNILEKDYKLYVNYIDGNDLYVIFTIAKPSDIPPPVSQIPPPVSQIPPPVSQIPPPVECTGLFKKNNPESPLICHIQTVTSTLGNRTGSFLFNIQVLLAIMTNCHEIQLDNVTDDPARAASKTGIYGAFTVDKRGSDRSDFVGIDLHDQLIMSSGEMRLSIDTNSYRKWKLRMQELSEKIPNSKIPWSQNPSQGIKRFLLSLHQQQGGKINKPKSKSKRKFRGKSQKKITKKYHKIPPKNMKKKSKTKKSKIKK
jgi:hypothetical protein